MTSSVSYYTWDHITPMTSQPKSRLLRAMKNLNFSIFEQNQIFGELKIFGESTCIENEMGGRFKFEFQNLDLNIIQSRDEKNNKKSKADF